MKFGYMRTPEDSHRPSRNFPLFSLHVYIRYVLEDEASFVHVARLTSMVQGVNLISVVGIRSEVSETRDPVICLDFSELAVINSNDVSDTCQ